MIYFLRKHAGKILIITLIAFTAGIFFSAIGPGFIGGGASNQNNRPNINTIAMINDKPMSLAKYGQNINQYLMQLDPLGEGKIDPYQYLSAQYQAFIKTLENELILEEAKKSKLRVSNRELNNQIDAILEANKMDERTFAQELAKRGYDYKQFKNDVREDMLVAKYISSLADEFNVSDKDVEESLTSLRVRHILIDEAEDSKSLSKANEILAKIKAGQDFAALAKEHSKDPGSAQNGGELPWFSRGRMVKEFEDAAYSLQEGQIYDSPVKSTYGYHIIELLGTKKQQLPPNTDIESYKKELAASKRTRIIGNIIGPAYENANIEILDENLKAYKLQTEGKYQEALELIKKIAAQNPSKYFGYVLLGDVHARLEQYDEAMDAYKRAETIQEVNNSKDAFVNLARGFTYVKQGKEAEAKKNNALRNQMFQAAGREFARAKMLANDNIHVHNRLQQGFSLINWTRDAKNAEDAVKRLQKQIEDKLASQQS